MLGGFAGAAVYYLESYVCGNNTEPLPYLSSLPGLPRYRPVRYMHILIPSGSQRSSLTGCSLLPHLHFSKLSSPPAPPLRYGTTHSCNLIDPLYLYLLSAVWGYLFSLRIIHLRRIHGCDPLSPRYVPRQPS